MAKKHTVQSWEGYSFPMPDGTDMWMFYLPGMPDVTVAARTPEEFHNWLHAVVSAALPPDWHIEARGTMTITDLPEGERH